MYDIVWGMLQLMLTNEIRLSVFTNLNEEGADYHKEYNNNGNVKAAQQALRHIEAKATALNSYQAILRI